MLGQEFEEVWILGELDWSTTESLKRIVREAGLRRRERIKFVYYSGEPGNLSYVNSLRAVLLENTLLTIVVEDKSLEEFVKDVGSVKKLPRLIKGRGLPNEIMRIIREMEGDGHE